MTNQGNILIADDETTFAQSTADLLESRGYRCQVAPDAESAREILEGQSFDLLICDIKMPGNPKLEFIRNLPQVAEGLPVILVTGFPSLETAMDSVELPVVAYMTKPIEIEDLAHRVQSAIQRSRTLATARLTENRLGEWKKDLEDLQSTMTGSPDKAGPVPVDTYVNLSIRNIIHSLSDLKSLMDALGTPGSKADACHLFHCQRRDFLVSTLEEVIGVLRKTKGAFKSKDLGALRVKLEGILREERS